MEIIPAAAGGTFLQAVVQDYRQRHGLSEVEVLNPLMEALATRQARAFLALQEGRAVGAVLLSRKGHEGLIHLLHALPEFPAAQQALLDRAEQELLQEQGLAQITATLPLLPEDTLEAAFRERGYQAIMRARMILDLTRFEQEVALPAGYGLAPWTQTYQAQAAALVRAAHQGSADVALYPEVASTAGARRLVARILGGGFGAFDPALSPLILAERTLAGLCLAVWHLALPGQGFIVDLCVDLAHRRRGLGRALVVATARGFRRSGARSLGLAVTLSNRPAVQLYQGLGFQVEQRFALFRRVL